MKSTIGRNIKYKRTESGMTLEDVASKTGVSRQTIQRYESGVISNIPSDKIEKIANALHTTPSYLMGWENTEQTFAENITANRKRLNMTIAELAQTLNITVSTLMDWEKGIHKPNQQMVNKLCQAFGVTYDEMYGLASATNDTTVAAPNDQWTVILLESTKQLSEESKRRLLTYAKKLLELDELE